MFGQNKIIGRKFFTEQEQSRNQLLVTSVFITLQGEGPLAGMPAVFVRLAHCNLNCSFCDTYFDSGDWMSTSTLMDVITKQRFEHTPEARQLALVITGGEPMLQSVLSNVLSTIHPVFKYTQIESNGLLYLDLPNSTILVVSPKCRNKKYLQPNTRVLERANCLKFVISSDPKSPYNKVPYWALDWRQQTGRDVFVSPMNEYNRTPEKAAALYNTRGESTFEERSTIGERVSFWEPGLLNLECCRLNHEYAAEYCMKNDLRLSLQMQLFASIP